MKSQIEAPRPLPLNPSHASSGAGGDERSPLDLAAGERWYVVMTLPHKERYAAANLANQGIRRFLPLQHATVRHARQFRKVLQPVFPRYLFVALNVQKNRWRNVNGTFGVQYLLCSAEAPLAVPEGVIETLAQSADAQGIVNYKADNLAPGDKVRLVSGPFAGALGVLQRLDGAGRVQLLLDVMGASFRMTAPRELVRVVV